MGLNIEVSKDWYATVWHFFWCLKLPLHGTQWTNLCVKFSLKVESYRLRARWKKEETNSVVTDIKEFEYWDKSI